MYEVVEVCVLDSPVIQQTLISCRPVDVNYQIF